MRKEVFIIKDVSMNYKYFLVSQLADLVQDINAKSTVDSEKAVAIFHVNNTIILAKGTKIVKVESSNKSSLEAIMSVVKKTLITKNNNDIKIAVNKEMNHILLTDVIIIFSPTFKVTLDEYLLFTDSVTGIALGSIKQLEKILSL